MYSPLTTVEDIAAHYKTISFSELTSPTESQVNEWINQGTAVIYSNIKDKYSVPVSDDSDLLVLKNLCNLFVLAYTDSVMRGLSYATKIGSMPSKGPDFTKFYEELKRLTSGELLLNTSSGSIMIGDSYNQEYDIEPQSSKEEDIW